MSNQENGESYATLRIVEKTTESDISELELPYQVQLKHEGATYLPQTSEAPNSIYCLSGSVLLVFCIGIFLKRIFININ